MKEKETFDPQIMDTKCERKFF